MPAAPPPGRPKAYSYLRMSTDLQLKGDSRRRQLEASNTYAEEHGLELVDDAQLEDIGISAFKGDNIKEGAFGRFLSAVQSGTVEKGSYLLVESLDRITRQELLTSQQIFLGIVQSGVHLVTLNDQHVYKAGETNLVDLITSLVIMSRAHEESLTKSRRVAAAWDNKRKMALNKPMTKMCPAWLRLSNDRSQYEVIEGRAKIIQSIFRDAAGGIGIYTIAQQLNQNNTPTFSDSDGWHSSYIAKILNNRAAIGEFQPHKRADGIRVPDGDPIRGYFPAVVDEELFYKAQAGRAQRRVTGRGRKGEFVSNLFSGLARCAYCHSKMKFENKGGGPKGGQYLVCERARRHLGCHNARWQYSAFEASFVAFVRELDIESILASSEQAVRRQNLESELTALIGEIGALNELMERTYALLNAGGAIEFISSKLKEHENKRKNLQDAVASKQAELRALDSQIAGFYESKGEIKSLLRRLQEPAGDDEYKLRAQIASKLKMMIDTLLIAPRGRAPRVEKTIEFLSAEENAEMSQEVVASLKQSLDLPEQHRRYFAIGFKDGSVRVVTPAADDPLIFEEQLLAKGGGLDMLSPNGRAVLFSHRLPENWAEVDVAVDE